MPDEPFTIIFEDPDNRTFGIVVRGETIRGQLPESSLDWTTYEQRRANEYAAYLGGH